MKRVFLALGVALASWGASGQVSDTAVNRVDSLIHNQSVGLVLSGGGAKGIAHIGVIQALEDNNIPIDYIAGTSMGSIVGGLYASGYTPAEMMALILSQDFSYWSTGRINPDLEYYFSKAEPTPVMVSLPVNLSREKTVTRFPKSLISPLPMNFAFMELFAPYTAQCGGNFDNLFVPFRCVTSDVKNKRMIVCSRGHLSDAIRASMSFPVVFQPIEMDSVLVYDGGIYDNFPVDVMRSDFAPSIMIGVDVHGTTDPADAHTLINQIEDMVIQNNDYDLPADEGIKLRINLDEFSLLDFPAAQQIYQIGYDHAMAMMDSIKTRITARVPDGARELRRAVFKSATPALRFDTVKVEGGDPQQNEYIKYLFTHNRPDTFGCETARLAYYRAITPGKLSDLFPQADYNEKTDLFTLNMRADVKNDFNVGLGCYLTSSVNSMAFVSARYTSLSFNTFDASVDAWIGQSYMAAQAIGRWMLPTHTPTSLALQGVISRRKYYESDKVFFDTDVPTFVTTVEGYGRLRYAIALGRSAKTGIDLGGGSVIKRFYNGDRVDYKTTGRDETRFNVAQARWSIEGSTIDNITYPTRGYSYKGIAMWNVGRYRYRPGSESGALHERNVNWLQTDLKVEYYHQFSRHFSLGGVIEGVWSNRSLLDTYNASIVNASAYSPTPAADSYFNPAFRANTFAALGVVPVWMINDNMQLRGHVHLFQPYRTINRVAGGEQAEWGSRFARRYVYTELAAVYNLRFALLSVYGNYQSYPARNWNVGISFGLYFTAPRLF